jgi:hypothetical protein
MFWDPKQLSYHNSNNSEGSYSEGRYVLWPVSVFNQAIADAARIYPKEISPMLAPAFRAYDHYYSKEYHAYCASYDFNGNRDIYYDDNAQVASSFLSAYEVTGDRIYLDKGVENVHFLMGGQQQDGGVRWHIAKEGCNTCTTAECGIAAMRLARFVQNNQVYIQFAKKCCDWIFNKVQADDKLICDGLESDGHGGLKRNDTKWTYNQGTPLTLCSLLYAFTKEEIYFERAHELALAVTDHNTAIFDRDTLNMDARYYRDHTYFYQLLAEGLADYLLFFESKSPPETGNQIKGELMHTIKYVYEYLRDPTDQLYYQSFEIFRISKDHWERFKQLTGEGKEYQPSGAERETADDSVPMDNRKLVKCLMGTASAARIFFQTARVHPVVG